MNAERVHKGACRWNTHEHQRRYVDEFMRRHNDGDLGTIDQMHRMVEHSDGKTLT